MEVGSDCFLDFSIKNTFLFTADDVLNHLDKKVKHLTSQSNLYMFLTAPKIRFIQDSVNLSENYIKAEVEVKIEGVVRRLPWKAKFDKTIPDDAYIGFNGDFTQFHLADQNKKILRGTNFYAHEILPNEIPQDFVFTIMYIGQSFGKKGNINFIDRAQRGHETLSKIMGGMLNQPDHQLYVLGLDVERNPQMLMINNFAPLASKKELSLKDQITLTESSLIRHFKPKFNKEFVKNHPNLNSPMIKRAIKCGATGVLTKLDIGLPLKTSCADTYRGKIILVTFHNNKTIFESDVTGLTVSIIRPIKRGIK